MYTCSRSIASHQDRHALGQEGVFTGSCKSKILQLGALGDEEAVEGGRQRHSSCQKILLEVVYGLRHWRKSTKHPGTVCRTAVGERHLHCMTRGYASTRGDIAWWYLAVCLASMKGGIICSMGLGVISLPANHNLNGIMLSSGTQQSVRLSGQSNSKRCLASPGTRPFSKIISVSAL